MKAMKEWFKDNWLTLLVCLIITTGLVGCCVGYCVSYLNAEKVKTQKQDFLDYVDLCVYTQFHIDYQDRELIVSNTQEIKEYYLTDIYYRIEYINNVYQTKYISAINDKNELVIKEIVK